MKILLIHNNYGIHSGEEAVVDRQIALFREMGHTVDVYRKTTEGKRDTFIGEAKGFFTAFYSPSSVKDIKNILKTNRPDVVIIHNLYPYISPAILKPIKQAGVPIIMTVHNFRLICPTGLFMRDFRPCELCLEKGNEWSCIQYNCEHSRLKSIGYAGRNWYARKTKAYLNHVDFYACITQFQIQKLIQAGYDPEKMVYMPNFIEKAKEPDYSLGDYVAISGRLSREKGIDLILEVAAKTPHIKYVFAGSPRKEEPITTPIPKNCLFLGHIPINKLGDFYKNARFLLIASLCYEGFPMTIPEAAAYGKPTIGPAHAGFLEIIDDNKTGLLFKPGDSDDLFRKITSLWDNKMQCRKMGKNAYEKLKNTYTSAIVKNKWNQLFEKITFKIFPQNLCIPDK
ncbi:MAG: glycosyltransferase family 4 protein [Candidatus Symbiothrix sp.]|jgi:glycosyltransferase involved in cell wall biosynthesis|nr:glycosyltransferase family 4 protein [Candidatus Symbiothrix sp.]